MKKIIFAGLTVLLALALITCIDTPNGAKDNDVPFIQSYSADRVTINFDGKGDAESGRALSKTNATAMYDYLEVVFRNNATIARASWEVGKAMSITGVPRGTEAAPVDYTSAGGLGTLTAVLGEATLFVGKKMGDGYVLMAIGKIVEIDGVPLADILPAANANKAIISPTTQSVTFGLSALVGNTKFTPAVTIPTPAAAFTTSLKIEVSDGGATPVWTVIDPALFTVPGTGATVRQIPGFQLTTTVPAAELTFRATYTLNGSALASFPIADMLKGVIYTVDASTPEPWLDLCKVRQALYIAPNAEKFPINSANGIIVPSITLTADSAIPADIVIDIKVPAGSEGVTSFNFNIPVVALTKADSSAVPPVKPIKWYVRPGTNLYSLDDGTENGNGSCFFVAAKTSPNDALTIGIR